MIILVLLQIITAFSSSTATCPSVYRQSFCDEIYHPVCAYDRLGNIIQQFSNSCEACKGSTTAYYSEGNCSDTTTTYTVGSSSSVSSSSKCDEETRYTTDCSTAESMACGIFSSLNCTVCEQEYYNSCIACSDSSVEYYYYGSCSTQILLNQTVISCPPQKPEICPDLYTDTCAFTRIDCSNSDCTSKSSSGCAACSGQNIVAYYLGTCEKYLEKANSLVQVESLSCGASRPLTCNDIANPACGWYNCSGEKCSKDYINPCQACADPTISAYSNGACQNSSVGQVLSFAFLIIILTLVI